MEEEEKEEERDWSDSGIIYIITAVKKKAENLISNCIKTYLHVITQYNNS